MRIAFWAAVAHSLGVLAAPTAAQAQATDTIDPFAEQYSGGFNLGVRWLRPNSADGGRIDCTGGATGCAPLNLQACDEPPRPVAIELSRTPTSNIPMQSHLWVWLATSSSCTGLLTDIDNDRRIVERELLTFGDPLVDGSPTPLLNFPEYFSMTFNTDDLWDREAACEGAGVNRQTRYICFGVDRFNFQWGGTDDRIDSLETRGWARFEVDTVPPPPPTKLVALAFDGAVVLEPTVSDGQDVGRWIGRIRPLGSTEPDEDSDADPFDAEGDATPCAQWDMNATNAAEVTAVAFGESTTTLRIAAENGFVYEACIYVQDRAGNPSDEGPRATATPVDECDFLECYPGELRTGYCSASLGQPMAAWFIMALLFGRLLRRRRD